MTDATVVSLCRQYLETWDNGILPVLCDAIEESDADPGTLPHGKSLRTYLCKRNRTVRFDVTVPAILRLYSGEGGQ